jgi:hypothetical protein
MDKRVGWREGDPPARSFFSVTLQKRVKDIFKERPMEIRNEQQCASLRICPGGLFSRRPWLLPSEMVFGSASNCEVQEGVSGNEYGFEANKGTHRDFYTSDYKYA